MKTAFHSHEQGSTLLGVILLLLLASSVSLLAVRVGIFEQKASANEERIRWSQQMADAALTQGMEWVHARRSNININDGTWERCQADDNTFPCGAIPASRRDSMYRFIGGTIDVYGDGTVDDLDERFLPISAAEKITSVTSSTGGIFPVQYGIGVVLCQLETGAVGDPAICDSTPDTASFMHAFTLITKARIENENANASSMKTVVAYSTLGIGASQPPLMASGSVDITGGIQVVTNPNSGGKGVPISVWTRKDVEKTGTPNTCYADEFFRLGAKNNSVPELYPSGASAQNQTLICDDCACPSDASLSFSDSGGACGEGMDILDIDNNTCGSNKDVKPTEFPCDLFKHIFGVEAWRDTNGDNFCETRINVTDPEEPTATIGADEKYLAENANWVIPSTTTFDKRFDGDSRVITCKELGEKALGGLIWDRTGSCGDGINIGTPGQPALFVTDGDISLQNINLFGVLFARSNTAGPLDPDTGGTAQLRFNASSIVYGAALVQGRVVKANGTSAIVYDQKVLRNLANNPAFQTTVALPGSWSDQTRF